jgi:hypothetical protein
MGDHEVPDPELVLPDPRPAATAVLVDTLRNRGVSILRTGVPMLWGYVLTWMASTVPALKTILERPEVVGFSSAITFALALGWYALMRYLEPRLPAWLTRVVLGANARPAYVDPQRPPSPPSPPSTPIAVRGDVVGDFPGSQW